jgi:hypothetical protein
VGNTRLTILKLSHASLQVVQSEIADGIFQVIEIHDDGVSDDKWGQLARYCVGCMKTCPFVGNLTLTMAALVFKLMSHDRAAAE